MYQMANGATGTQMANKPAVIQTTKKPNSKFDLNEAKYDEVDLSKAGEGALPCYTGSDPKNCKSFDEKIKDLPSFNSLNVESQKQLASIASAANGVNGTSKISSGSLQGSTALAGSANALRNAFDKAKKKSAEDLKKAGSKFNIDDQTKKVSNAIESGVRNSLKKSNSSAAGMVSTLYGGGGAGSAGTSASQDSSKAEEGLTKTAAIASGVIDIGAAGDGTKSDLGLSGIESGAPAELSPEELAKLNESQKATMASTIDDFDLKKDDISKDTSTSLFDLISNRYQQSGYPRLFKVKEVREDAPTNK
jgi:hypothetical protein